MVNEYRDPSIHANLHLYDGTDFDTIVQRVAYGGFGVIAFGPNKLRGGEMVAYKTLRRELLADPKAYATFVRECLLWIGLWDHPNIASVFAVMEMGDAEGLRPFIALRYAANGSLRDTLNAAYRLPGGRLPLEEGLFLAQQIAAGLTYLHTPDPAYLRDEPTVHRDLKPENVLLMGDGRAVITDFGLAKIIEEASPETLISFAALLAGGALGGPHAAVNPTRTTGMITTAGVGLGTPAYMPPEQWQDARHASTPADVYALGLMLSELLAGRHPLLDVRQGHTPAEWERAHALPNPGALRAIEPRIPLGVEMIYLRCLAVDPAARPRAADVLAALQEGARAAGMEVYEAPEIAAHSAYNELVHWHQWSGACLSFARYEEALQRNDRALNLARDLARERPELLPTTLTARGTIFTGLGKQALEAGDAGAASRWDAQAMVAYQEALAAFPPETTEEGRVGRAMVWHQLGVLHSARRQWPLAESDYAKALDLKPDMSDTFYNRANNLAKWAVEDARGGRRADATGHLRQARVYAITSVTLGDPMSQGLLKSIEEMLHALGVA